MAESPKRLQADEPGNRQGATRRLFALLRPYRLTAALAVVLTISLSLFLIARPILIEHILDGPVRNGNLDQLRWMVAGLIGLLLAHTAVMYVTQLITNRLALDVMLGLRRAVFDKLASFRMRFFDQTPLGTLQTRVVSDVETLYSVFSQGFITIVGELLSLFAILAYMFWTSWELSLVVLTTLPLILGATAVFRVKVRAAFNRVRKYVAELNAFAQEHISGLVVTQAFNREAQEEERFRTINERHRKAHVETILYYSIFFPVIEWIAALGLALLTWYGGLRVLSGGLGFGEFTGFLLAIQMLFRPIRQMAEQVNTLQMGAVSAGRLFGLLDREDVIPEAKHPTPLPLKPGETPSIAFEGVTFGYKPEEPILHDITFTAPAGATTALVGATGSGKSSILNVLMRYYGFQAGTVRFNDVDIRELKQDELRQAMGLVQQDPYLFAGTLQDNITLWNPAIDQSAVEHALDVTGVGRWVQRLPDGLNFHVGERGQRLSTGQRQLVALVRVLVYNPAVLLLDEATANVDTETEMLIQDALNSVLTGRTAIVIAHRLSTIQHAEQILVLHRGRLVERGRHQELLELGGRYAQLHRLHHGLRAVPS